MQCSLRIKFMGDANCAGSVLAWQLKSIALGLLCGGCRGRARSAFGSARVTVVVVMVIVVSLVLGDVDVVDDNAKKPAARILKHLTGAQRHRPGIATMLNHENRCA